jgi:hypothetical protein
MRRPLPRHPVRVLLLALGFVLANLAVRVGVWWGLGFLDPGLATVEINPHEANYGTPVTVSISYPFRFITPIVRGVFGREITLKASVTVRSEHVR